MIAAGQSPVQIAGTSGRAAKTIRNQIQAVDDKLGVGINRELADTVSVFRAVGVMVEGRESWLAAP